MRQLLQRRAVLSVDREYRLLLAVTAWAFLLAVAVLALLPFRSEENVGAVALVMLLPPLAATGSGPIVAAAAALVTGVAFNFFFTKPYDSPRISSSASVAAFVIYLVVAVVLAVLTTRLREARHLADRRARDATLLQSLTVEMIRNASLVATLRSALVELADTLGLRGACLQARAGEVVATATAGDARASLIVARALVPGGSPARPTVVSLRRAGEPAAFPIVTVDTVFGFVIADAGEEELGEDRHRVLESFAGVVALALAQARLAEEGVRRRSLEETDRLRTILLQSVSHDLRTPLTAIKAAASTLLDADPPVERRRELLADVEAEADRLSRLVANLLDLSRIESGTLQPNHDAVPVDELVSDAVDAARHALAGAEVEIVIPSGLPAVDIDETMIRQVLVNLLENAARYGASSKPIRVDAAVHPSVVEIRVVDHGAGIPEAERHRVFEPYNRLRPGDQRGSGLGLVISRGFVEANGGSIRVEPTPGGGATFVMSVPQRSPA